jgi:gluconolactonase
MSNAATCTLVVGGFRFVEGPVWHPDGFLIFSDILGDTIYRWSESSGIEVWRRPSNMANGLTLGPDGALLACEHATSRLVRIEGSEVEVLASHFEGRELNSPNDVIVDQAGRILFTDPTAGRSREYGVERPVELTFSGIYRVTDDMLRPELLYADMTFPNGLCTSPDGRALYVTDTVDGLVASFDIDDRGNLGERRILTHLEDGTVPGPPDGIKVDELGRIYSTGPGGLWVLSREGEVLDRVQVPEPASNLVWAGEGCHTLYVTATTSVYRVELP